MGRTVGVRAGGWGRGGQKLEETRVGVTRHREHVALTVENGSHVHAESTCPSALGVGSTETY